ncbi:MAG: glycosyltransferase family 2 protein [Alphaproteobacteria bacterium]|nr:glycosyltransferase family 2 protein [Alphaproteobacteria bacterium]
MRKNVKKFYQSKRKENDKSSEIIKVKNANSEAETTAEILVQNRIDYTPKVSVVMPVYNVEDYLRQCLDSVINQSLKEIEIICVDDGSTDGSLEILKEYASKDKRITLCAQSHIGSGKCRNIALSLVRGNISDLWILMIS